jgi:type IV pilus assembly protein PilB
MAATASQSNLSGLPRRLVQDGIVTEEVIQEAQEAARKEKMTLVAYLVANEKADSKAVAVAASHEFGVPLLDLDSIEIELETLRAVDQKLLTKHRVLPLLKRGQKLFLGISDPTNLQAIDDVKFQTSLRIDPIVVEEAKLEERIARALEAVDTTMSSLEDEDLDLENLDVSGVDDEEEDLGRDDIEDAPVVRFVNKVLLDAIKRGASDVHFEPYEKLFRVRSRLDGVLSEIAQPPVALANKVCARLKVMSRMDIGTAAGCTRQQGLRSTQGHVADGHRGTARAAGRPYQDAPVEKAGNRLSCQYLPDPVRREDRTAYSRSLERQTGYRRARLRRPSESDVPEVPQQAVRHDPGHRTNRLR